MTIHVQVTNKDTRPGAVVRVTSQNDGHAASHLAPRELDAGQSAEFLVHDHQQLFIEEVSQP